MRNKGQRHVTPGKEYLYPGLIGCRLWGGVLWSPYGYYIVTIIIMEKKYIETIKISKEDKEYLKKLKEKYPKMSLAGINSYIIKTHRENNK